MYFDEAFRKMREDGAIIQEIRSSSHLMENFFRIVRQIHKWNDRVLSDKFVVQSFNPVENGWEAVRAFNEDITGQFKEATQQDVDIFREKLMKGIERPLDLV